ncbi:MAG: ATP-binding protein [Candidatus Riflebacteria bacterium]|nr:ATP-binding protein [Candidatus Riflebacteria bacterium]
MARNIEVLIQQAGPESVLVELQMHGDPRCLALIRRLIGASATSIAITGLVLNDIKLAVTEACTNVIKHAYKYDNTRKFELKLLVSPYLFQVRISYNDPGFDPSTIPVPDLTRIQEGGFGVFIMRQIMDDVFYHADSTSGAVELRLVKILDTVLTNSGG